MILKKPYAFLIKYFKIIHIIIFILAFYINSHYNKISSFFKNYTSTAMYDINIAKDYLPTIVFISVIILIGLFIIMLYLMNKKDKPTKLYIFSIIYYVIIFITMFIAYNTIDSLFEGSLEQRTSRLYRDIYFMLNLPNYYFMFMYLIRGIGFDIKKFNFKKDLQELEINASDNEEFEFVLGNDAYKYKRKAHRIYREIIYFYKENKFIINVILGVLGAIILTIILINICINLHKYHVGSSVNSSKFTYKLNNAYVTSYDYEGNQINRNKRYVLIDMTITNRGENKLKPEDIYLAYNNKQSTLKLSLANSFSDIGNIYKGDIIPNKPTNLILVYEIPNNKKIYNTKLMVYTKTVVDGEKTDYVYKEYKFKLKDLDKNQITKTIKLNDNIQYGKQLYGNTNMTITNIELMDKYEYTYQKCKQEDNCQTITDVVSPENKGLNQLLMVDYTLNIDDKSLLYRSTNANSTQILNKFSKIQYTYKEEIKETTIYGKTITNLENKIFYEVPKTINKEDTTKKFIIKTRENEYKLNF